MYGGFTRATEPDTPIGNEISWSTNPTYQSPESSGVSWYDQINHWDANDENVEAIPSSSGQNFEPYWAARQTDGEYSWTSGPELSWGQAPKTDTIGIGANQTEATIETSAADDQGGLDGISEAVSGIEEATEGVEVAEEATEVAEGFSGIGIGALIAQQFGSATTDIISAGLNEQSAQDYSHNIAQQGIGAQLQSQIISANEKSNIENITAASRFGDFLGPIGASIGAAVGIATNQPNSSYLNTANSFNGMINPQDTGIVQSLNTSAPSGETQQIENV